MTTDPFTEAAAAEARQRSAFEHGARWARTHLAAQRAEEVRDWAVQQYPSGTPLDQDRRMVAAETEAYLSGRTDQEMSELARAAKHAGPVDPPAQEPTDAEIEAAAIMIARDVSYDADPDLSGYRIVARAALTAARAARRDEEQ